MKRELAQALAPALLLMALAAALEGVCALLLAAAVASWRQNPGHWLGLLALATPLALAVQYAAATRGFFAGGAVMNALLRALFRRLPRALSPQEQAPGLLTGAIGQAMSAPAHLLAPLVGAIVTPLTLVAGLACQLRVVHRDFLQTEHIAGTQGLHRLHDVRRIGTPIQATAPLGIPGH
mgnify:CR=1 FL=1